MGGRSSQRREAPHFNSDFLDNHMLRLECVVQNYEWGKKGSSSAVASLQGAAGSVAIDENKTYAEYWFGTHSSGPSKVILEDGTRIPLQTYLLENPAILGSAPYNPTSALPYLFKVLSVAKALSIQAHPDRDLAVRLHAARPDQYKDDNHKPEMAVALTPFQAMCGFRAPGEIMMNLTRAPELASLIGGPAVASFQAAIASDSDENIRGALRGLFEAYMTAPPDAVAAATGALASRLAGGGGSADGGAVGAADGETWTPLDPDAVASRLLQQYPGDIGVFSPYILNTLTLAPGSAVFLGANEPHAYLDGDCAEVMACSDNVVRAGLTPKWKDVETLTSMLTYSTTPPAVVTGEVVGRTGRVVTKAYPAPVPEFLLYSTSGAAAGGAGAGGEGGEGGDGEPHTLPVPKTAAIMVVVKGSGTLKCNDGKSIPIKAGDIWLQPAGTSAVLTEASSDVHLFQAVSAE